MLFSVLGLSFLQSCDPAKILIVKTNNKPNYSVTIYTNENILPQFYPYHQDSNAKKMVIHVPTEDTFAQTEKIFLYGIGGWADKSGLLNFSKNIDSIIIVNDKGKLTLNKQNAINVYLMKHRHGFAKHVLTIEAK